MLLIELFHYKINVLFCLNFSAGHELPCANLSNIQVRAKNNSFNYIPPRVLRELIYANTTFHESLSLVCLTVVHTVYIVYCLKNKKVNLCGSEGY